MSVIAAGRTLRLVKTGRQFFFPRPARCGGSSRATCISRHASAALTQIPTRYSFSSRPRKLTMACRAQGLIEETVTIVGGGRVGSALKDMCANKVDVVKRGGKVAADGSGSGPIIVCTRNDDLQAVLDATPPERHEDLVFIQNGMLQPWLEEKGLGGNTQALVYFAVAKLGEKPIDGKTELNPEGLTAVTGKHAKAFASILESGGLSCKVLEKEEYQKAMLEKLIWISVMMLVGVRHSATVGEVVANHKDEVASLTEELAAAGSANLGITLEDNVVERLCSYSMSVAHFPTALKEFEWRNGFFYNLSKDAAKSGKPDPCPTHTEWLRERKMPATPKIDVPPFAIDTLNFINKAWTQFHAVEESSKLLLKAGFQHLSERDNWELKPGGRYFFTRNKSTLVAFAVGAKYVPGNGFNMVGAHTDSPCLKLKPCSKSKKSGFLMINAETYGGGLWHTWFDRDLSVAGRVLVKEADGKTLSHKLVKVERPIMRIPMLAIHLSRNLYSEGFKPNHQTHLAPMLATAVKTQVEKKGSSGEEESRHHPLLLDILAEELGCLPEAIVDFELNVCDTQPGVIGGANNEFMFVGRLDNLSSSYGALRALVDSTPDEAHLANETAVRAIALFDHEEVGSTSAVGAGGPVMRDTISRVSKCMSGGETDAVERAFSQSFLVSADMAHALHPNYSEKHDGEHIPEFHKGLVVKTNNNQRYASNLVSSSLFIEVGKRRGIPSQHFCVRNDMPCGSTIGPILSSNLGCRTVDVGAPQLSMHSIREMCGVVDLDLTYQHFMAFFETFAEVDGTLDVDGVPPPLGTIEDTPCEHVH
ncbi:hypothetical protein BSKO_03695 [Bryopsis sp. KO-2023]|nr:hypothetical protein BSKO_03695 [Bryopsis sp. KO-2023]